MQYKIQIPAAFKIYVPAAIGLLLIGALYVSTNMMGFSQEYMSYLENIVKETPTKFGDWEGTDNEQANEAITKESGAEAQISRVYDNSLLGEQINLYFIAGKSFRVAMHSPIVCYPGSGFEQQGEVQTFDFDYVYTNSKTGKKYARKASFFTVVFKKEDRSERVFWAWNDGSGWEAPQFARLHYGGHIPLCKCYFSFVNNSSSVYDFNKEYIVDFATRFLSDLDNRLLINGQLPQLFCPQCKAGIGLDKSMIDNKQETIISCPHCKAKINVQENIIDKKLLPTVKLGEELDDSQLKQEKQSKPTESDISPSILPTNDNFDSLLKESETINE